MGETSRTIEVAEEEVRCAGHGEDYRGVSHPKMHSRYVLFVGMLKQLATETTRRIGNTNLSNRSCPTILSVTNIEILNVVDRCRQRNYSITIRERPHHATTTHIPCQGIQDPR